MNASSVIYQTYVKILQRELVPAMGCTEPIALAYCAAKARAELGDMPDRIRVEASGNIIKNVKSVVVPHMTIVTDTGGLRVLPEVAVQLDIPQIMPVMSALVFSIFIGIAAVWSRAYTITKVLQEFQQIVLKIVERVVIPILPFFIAATFCCLAWEGSITKQLPIFLIVIVIVLAGHFIWLTVLYSAASVYSGCSGLEVVKNYGPAYITAIGTMSSAATLAVALKCAHKSKNLRPDMVDFGVPLFANIHLCGSVLTEVFFVMTVLKVLYGQLPSLGSMILFVILLGIFALQDSFGTACNVTGDGALTLILTGYAKKHGVKESSYTSIEF